MADAQGSEVIPDRLAEIVRSELETPEAMATTFERLGDEAPSAEFWSFLKAKDLHHRASFYLRTENLIYRRLGWRLMRPLFLLAITAALGFSLQRKMDPTIGVGLFLAGAAAFFVTLQILVHRWAWKGMRELERIDADYRRSLNAILGDDTEASD
jgi:hypothetical protein